MPGTTDTVKAMLTPGEFVIRKEAVDMIGVPILEKLNDMPEAGGHSEIDRLIAQATLKNMTGMYGGGMVNAKQYMGGGKVDMYGHGGKVKNQMMMGYEHGGEAHGNLKPVPDDNPGLAKLPEAVRNKMGYMQEGGEVEDSLMGMMYGGKAKKKKEMYGYQEGGQAIRRDNSYLKNIIDYMELGENIQKNDPLREIQNQLIDAGIAGSNYRNLYTNYGDDIETYKKYIESGKGTEKDKKLLNNFLKTVTKTKIIEDKAFSDLQNLNYFIKKGFKIDESKVRNPIKKLKDSYEKEIDILNQIGLPAGDYGYDLKRVYNERDKEVFGYQEGGTVQDSSMMMQPSPFIPFDQRPNQSPASGNWGEFGAYYNALKNNLQAEREELVADTARNALDSLKLDSLIKQMSGDAMRIERSPNEPFFFPNTPVQENFMQKYKEEMIDPTYFPEGN